MGVQKAGYGFEEWQIAALAVLGEIEGNIMIDIVGHSVHTRYSYLFVLLF